MKPGFIIYLLLFFLVVLVLSNLFFINNPRLLYIFARENKVEQIKLTTENIDELFLKARNNYYSGNTFVAINIYNQILVLEPGNTTALQNLSFITREIGDYSSALNYNNSLIEYNPDNLYLKFLQGILLYQKGDYIKAESLLANIYNKISEQEHTGEKNEAEDIQMLSAVNETLLYYYLGNLYLNNKELVNANKFFQMGIDKSPHITLNYLGQADVFKQKELYENALLAYKTALKRDSSLSFVYPEIALINEELGKTREAYYYWIRSYDTNNQKNLARKKLEVIKKEHPEFLEADQERKAKSRKKIEWVNIEPITTQEEVPLVRVGLSEKVNSINMQAGSNFKIVNKKGDIIYFEGQAKKEYNIKLDNNVFYIYHNENLLRKINTTSPLLIEVSDNATIVIYDINYGSGYFWAGIEDRQFRGVLELYPLNNNLFNVINTVNLEEYLFSVIPGEMPAWWPEEALKAQVIAARSYALSHLGRHSKDGYDLCATVHCAVYKGVQAENNRTNNAVLATRGQVGTYDNRIIDAVFSSNSGGYSESSSDVWGHRLPYLEGANSMLNNDYEFPLEPYKLEEWLINQPPSFSDVRNFSGVNIYRWTRIIDAEYLKSKYNLKNVTELIPVGRSQGGSINKIIIKGDDREIIISKDKIRSSLGGLKSNRFIIQQLYNKNGELEKIVFFGAGWGHNVGMDQTGAAGMADLGYNYVDIIKHYYKGVDIIEKY